MINQTLTITFLYFYFSILDVYGKKPSQDVRLVRPWGKNRSSDNKPWHRRDGISKVTTILHQDSLIKLIMSLINTSISYKIPNQAVNQANILHQRSKNSVFTIKLKPIKNNTQINTGICFKTPHISTEPAAFSIKHVLKHQAFKWTPQYRTALNQTTNTNILR